jgi:16S rRNA (guanine1207-N2)-methyltransferase
LWLNADAADGAGPPPCENLLCEQGFRPAFLRLEQAGHNVVPELADDVGAFFGALVFLGRNSAQNENAVCRAWNRVEDGGAVIVVGEKTQGIAPLRKRVAIRTEILDGFAKHHAQLFRISRSGGTWPEKPLLREVGGYLIGDGMFSAEGPDSGSASLAAGFDGRISGRVADLGAGWGYLGCMLVETGGHIDRLDSIEADWRSLQAARHNLRVCAPGLQQEFHWLDVASERLPHNYDWVVMNPPFHTGRGSAPAIGQAFIAVAAAVLRPGGRLLLVANRNLPYEASLARHFRDCVLLGEDGRYKRYEARR